MVEVLNEIERVYAVVIPDKKASTIIPIIKENVAPNTTIHTDESKSYISLQRHGYVHKTVCHKKSFVSADRAHTQHVESFNNCLKVEIKSRKGVRTNKRAQFLKELCFFYNNKKNLAHEVFNLIKNRLI